MLLLKMQEILLINVKNYTEQMEENMKFVILYKKERTFMILEKLVFIVLVLLEKKEKVFSKKDV